MSRNFFFSIAPHLSAVFRTLENAKKGAALYTKKSEGEDERNHP